MFHVYDSVAHLALNARANFESILRGQRGSSFSNLNPMKHRTTQIDRCKNPASPRVHGLHPAATGRNFRLADLVTKTELVDISIAKSYAGGGPPFEERTK